MTLVEWLLFVPPIICVALAAFAWRRRDAIGARAFIALTLAIAVWGVGYALEIAAGANLAVKTFWAAAKYLGIVATPVAWWAFALEYTGGGERLTRRYVAALAVVPAITVALAFTNSAHRLMWVQQELVTAGSFFALSAPFGPWFWVHAAYSYLLLALGTVALVRMLRRTPTMYRRQAGALLLAAAVPWAANALAITDRSPIPHLDLTSAAFTVSGLALGWALFRYRLLDIVPVARDLVLRSMSDAVFVIDARNRIIDFNPAGARLLDRTPSEVVGRRPSEVFPGQPDLVERYRDVMEAQDEIELGQGPDRRTYDLRISPVTDRRGRAAGRLVVMRDVSARRLAEELGRREQRMRYRAEQLQAVTEVARAVTSVQQLDELLPHITNVISDRFGFYHVGVFLLDAAGEYAELKAANSQGGQRMLARQHKLAVGQVGIVGHATGAGQARIALDVGSDAVYFDNPDLPETRSEMALPLKVANRVIGALDVQSTQPAAFTEEDVQLLSVLADQVAIAVENARAFERQAALIEDNRRLLSRAEQAVEELQSLTRRLTAEGWEQYLSERRGALRAEDAAPGELAASGDVPELDLAAERMELVTTSGEDRSAVAFPIELRGEVIGALALEASRAGRAWSEDEVDLIKDVAARASLALDNARLFEQAQRRVSELMTIDRVTRALSAQQGLAALSRLVVDEVRNALGVSDAYLALFDSRAQMIEVACMVEDGREMAVEPIPLGSGLTSAIIRRREPLLINQDAQQRMAELGARQVGSRHAKSYLGVPILAGDEVLGVVAIQDTHREGLFGQTETRLLSTIAPSIGIAIQNARLFDQIQSALAETRRRVQRERLINEVTAKIRGASNVEDVLRIAVDQLRQATRTTRASARLTAPSVTPANGHARPDAAQE